MDQMHICVFNIFNIPNIKILAKIIMSTPTNIYIYKLNQLNICLMKHTFNVVDVSNVTNEAIRGICAFWKVKEQ